MSVALGALLELILIVANVGTAVAPYAIFRRYSEGLALGYVAARLVEAVFIAIGIISALTFIFMRQEALQPQTQAWAWSSQRSMTVRS